MWCATGLLYRCYDPNSKSPSLILNVEDLQSQRQQLDEDIKVLDYMTAQNTEFYLESEIIIDDPRYFVKSDDNDLNGMSDYDRDELAMKVRWMIMENGKHK